MARTSGDRVSVNRSSTVTTINTTCPYCGVGCGVTAQTLNAPVAATAHPLPLVSVTGDKRHPANFGKLCAKGAALAETLTSELSVGSRLLTPRLYGVDSTWPDALDTVATRFADTIKKYGPDSVAFYVSGQLLTEDYYVVNKLVKGYIGTANIDTNSRLCMASSVAGHQRAFGSDTVPNTYRDLELADVIVLTGSNLAWCHPIVFQRILAEKERRPALQIVVIDPRRTMTAQQADLHLAIAPGTDRHLFNGLLGALYRGGHCDLDFIDQHTTGFADCLQHLPSFASVGKLTGLDQASIDRLYSLYATTAKVVTVFSQGVNQSETGTDTVNSIINVHLATGRVGKPGSGPLSITGQPNAMGGREVGGLANMLAAHMPIGNARHRSLVQSFWNSPRIATQPGLKAVDLFDAVSNGTIRALWIMATNPVDSMPMADTVAAALSDIPFLAVSDVTDQTDTAKYAHALLPAQAWGEKDGTVTNSERRISRQRRLVKPVGDAMPDWWMVCEVAKRMGYADGFDFDNAATVFREHAALSGAGNNGTRDFDISGCATITNDEYAQLAPFQWPLTDKPNLAANEPTADTEKRFFASGQFYHDDGLARFVIPVTDSDKQPSPLNTDRCPSSRYPLILNTGRCRDQWHTMTRTGHLPALTGHLCEPFVEINPKDAAACQLEDACIARVSSHVGDVLVRALITERQQAGCVFVPMHWSQQFSGNARIDAVIDGQVDPVSGQPALKRQPVSVSPWSPKSYAFGVFAEKPDISVLTNDADYYWAMVPVSGGWRAEFASRLPPAALIKTLRLLADKQGHGVAAYVNYDDGAAQSYRVARYTDTVNGANRLVYAMFIAAAPVAVARSFVADLLQRTDIKVHQRQQVLASQAPIGQPDKGAIVCSCQSVGVRQITTAIRDGCDSLVALGEKLNAGMTCGSCRGELSSLLAQHRKPAHVEVAH